MPTFDKAVWEFGERTWPNPGLAGSELGERPVPFSELLQVQSFEKGPGRTITLSLTLTITWVFF